MPSSLMERNLLLLSSLHRLVSSMGETPEFAGTWLNGSLSALLYDLQRLDSHGLLKPSGQPPASLDTSISSAETMTL